MEKRIKETLRSFLLDFDRRKLENLDNFLFSLLVKRELSLLNNKGTPETRAISKLLLKYSSFRRLIFNRLLKTNKDNRVDLPGLIYQSPSRLVLLVTHNCQLRCQYCRVSKFRAVMRQDILRRSIDLLFTSSRPDLQLQFFGGEPLLSYDLIQKGVDYAERLNKKFKRKLSFLLTTNGICLTKDKIDYFKKHRFLVECSFDGDIQNQLKMRKAVNGKNYYDVVLKNFRKLFESGTPHYAICVTMPKNVRTLFKNFKKLVEAGFKEIQLNYALGVYWPETSIQHFFTATGKILNHLDKYNAKFINLTANRREPVVLNAELTVDCDGGIYLESGICLEEDFNNMKKKFLVGNVSSAKDIREYSSTRFQNFYHLSEVYGSCRTEFRKIILNNIMLGQRFDNFLKNQGHGR